MPDGDLLDVTDKAAVQVTAVVTFVLWLKMVIVASMQGHYRFKSSTRPPEDSIYNMHARGTDIKFTRSASEASSDPRVVEALEQADRWTRIFTNDLENIPIGLVAAWASALATRALGGSLPAHLAGVAMLGVGRLGHTYCFAAKLPRLRTASYSTALVGTLVCLCQLQAAVF